MELYEDGFIIVFWLLFFVLNVGIFFFCNLWDLVCVLVGEMEILGIVEVFFVEYSLLRRKAEVFFVFFSFVRLGFFWNFLVVLLFESFILNFVMRFIGILLFIFIGSLFVCVLDVSILFLYGLFLRKSWRLWEILVCFRSSIVVMNFLE